MRNRIVQWGIVGAIGVSAAAGSSNPSCFETDLKDSWRVFWVGLRLNEKFVFGST